MKRRPSRRTLLAIASRLRKTREELSRAEEELELLLEDVPEPAAAPDVSVLAGEMAEAAIRLTRRGGVPARALRGEGAAEWMSFTPLRIQALLAATAQTLARSASRKQPSTAARVLAVLMEERDREFNASQVARRSGCSEPVARTTLNRLVLQGHARRTRAGLFRAA